ALYETPHFISFGSSPSDPQGFTSLPDIVAFALGRNHSCSLRSDGHAVCAGRNAEGEYGDGTVNPASTTGSLSKLVGGIAITAGDSHTCAIVKTGGVTCWGGN